MLRIGNLFDIERTPGDGERFDTLVAGSNVTIERIVSAGHASRPASGTTIRAPNGSCCCRARPYSSSNTAPRATRCTPATMC